MSFLAQQGLKEIKQQEVDPDKIILKIEKREAEEKEKLTGIKRGSQMDLLKMI